MSHRFKAFSPPFCAKNRVRLVPPENSAEIYFDRVLNRRSQDGVPRAFYVTFCTPQKVTTRTPLPGVPRFSKPRFSSPQWRLLTNKIKSFQKGASRFSKPRISPPKKQLRTNKLKFFCRSAAFFAACGGLFLPAATILAASRHISGGLAAFVTFLSP